MQNREAKIDDCQTGDRNSKPLDDPCERAWIFSLPYSYHSGEPRLIVAQIFHSIDVLRRLTLSQT